MAGKPRCPLCRKARAASAHVVGHPDYEHEYPPRASTFGKKRTPIAPHSPPMQTLNGAKS